MIMRRIDDLGRVVIPRDIRKSLRLSEGDVVDISVLDNKLILTKHFDNTIDELLSLVPRVEQEDISKREKKINLSE